MMLKLIMIVSAFLALGTKIPGSRLTDAFDAIFKKYADDPKLAKAVAVVESSLDPAALGDQGRAFGIMQIWYPTAQGHGFEGSPYGLLDAETNIYFATRELNHLVRAYGFERGIQGYNIGETRLRKGGSNPEYLSRVLREYGRVTI